MKKISSLLSVMAALSLGSALAAATPAGTAIGNQASASFNDASGNNTQTVFSNAVVTTVTAVPSFSVTPTSTGTPGVNGAGLTPAATQNAVPGVTVSFVYTITNTGNVTQDSYSLQNQGTYAATSGAAPQNLKYYTTDASGNCTTTVASTVGPLDPNQSAKICVVYTVPTGAANGDKLGTQPVVRLVPHTITSGSYSPPDGSAAITGPTVTETAPPDSNNNYNQALVSRSNNGLVGPYVDANANGFADSADTTQAVTAYQSPDPGASVTVNYGATNKDSQNAQATASTTVVTFLNSVANTGNAPDIFNLTAVPTNFPAGTTVSITDGSGNVITSTPSIAPGLGNEYSFRVKVVIPAGAAPVPAGAIPTVTITSTSQNSLPANGGSGVGGTDTTTDVLNIPGALFADHVPNSSTPANTQPNNPVTTTGGTTGTVTTNFPMVVQNTGSTPDTFALSATVTVNTPTGTATLPVTYYTDPTCSGTPTTTVVTTTPSLAPSGTYCVVASVAVPNNTLPGTYTLTNQTATGTLGEKGTDTDDKFTVQGTTNPLKPVKAVDQTTAAPGATLTYTITGSNANNANLTRYVLRDTVPTNTTFVSVSASITDANNYGTTGYTVLYRFNGGSWQTSATPATPPTAGQTVEVGIDTNGDTFINSSDILKPGQGISETFKVSINN